MKVPLEEDEARLAEMFLESQRKQERIAISSLIQVNKLVSHMQSGLLQLSLTNKASDMKSFSGSTIVSDLEGGFKGKTADTAKEYLQGILQPDLKSPIK